MSKFAVRVELNGPPSWEVYSQVHTALANMGLFKNIRGGDGRWHHLPDGTYQGDIAFADASSLRNHLQIVLGALWADHDFVVFRFDDAAWTLPVV